MELQSFDAAQVAHAMQMANAAAQSNMLPSGLTALTPSRGDTPIAWVDELGQVWPHEAGSATHIHINYLYTQDEVAAAMQASKGIIVVQTMPSHVVAQVTGEAPPPAMPDASPKAVTSAARARAAMLQTFNNPAGTAVRSE